MKYLGTLLVLAVLAFAGNANAQKATSTTGKSYTYVMKNIDGSGAEIYDQIIFNGNSVISEKLSSTGYKTGNVANRSTGASTSQFDVTFKSDEHGTMQYSGSLTEKSIDGTIIVTDKAGNKTTMAMRGMPTEEFNQMQKEKREYQETLQK